jgi:hypothetical protein
VAINTKQLNLYSKPVSQASEPRDINRPLPYKEWYTTHTGIIPGQELALYNAYLINWYTQKDEQRVDLLTQTRVNYLTLLRQLQIFYTSEEVETWYSKVDLNSEKEILIAIPYFAKKLKEIALYYLNIREEIKKNKIKYNVIGTSTGIAQELQEQLLTLFTRKENQTVTIPSTIWSNISELSSVKDNLVVEIEEFYDDHQYPDQTSSVPLSSYFDLNSNDLKTFFESKNIPLTAVNWIYEQGNFDLQDEELQANINLANEILQKYIGENKFATTLISSPSSSAEFYDIVVSPGNNIFYWPKGVYKPDISTVVIYEPVPLTASNIQDLGTAGDSILNSDTIFVKSAKGIQGAWLRFKEFNEFNTSLNSYIEGNKTTTFKYPLPGYGLSGEDLDWTGPSLDYTIEYPYLETSIKESINSAYWNTDTSSFQTAPILINETSLIDAGAYASEKYQLADRIKVFPSAPNYASTSYSGEVQETWLYKMTKTDIPIGTGENVILWPYQRVNPDEIFPTYIPSSINTVCEPLNLSSIPVFGATSSGQISAADKIYKLQNYTDTIDNAIEGAWLSGAEIRYRDSVSVISQPGLNGLFKAGQYTRFIWEGPDQTDADSVFKSISHQPDCTFTTTATSYKDFQLCTCYQTKFTPFGHPGTDYDEYNKLTDFIVEDFTPTQAFNLLNWKDETGINYASSPSFGWYKRNNTIGWGEGTWRTGSSSVNNKLFLRHGHSYIYYRANDNTLTESLPELVIRHPYTSPRVQWIKAIKNTDNQWTDTGIQTNMVIRPGDILFYEKANTTTYDYISAIETTQVIGPTAVNYNTIWSDYNFVTVGISEFGLPQSVTVSYPLDLYTVTGLKNDPTLSGEYIQYPPVNYNNLVFGYADWKLTDPFGDEYYILNKSQFTFQPNVTGIYTVELTAVTAENVVYGKTYSSNPSSLSGLMIFTNIPSITAINTGEFQTTNFSVSSILRDVPGYVINAQLYGWNYNSNKPASNTVGARPYWASSSTEYRDIDTWGTPFRIVDDHNILTQPIISDLTLNSNYLFEYKRNYPVSFNWAQPINFKVAANESVWSTIYIDTTSVSNFEDILGNLTNQLVARPSNDVSPIIFENLVNNEPVEVWYKALNAFVWNITATPVINDEIYSTPIPELSVTASRPWNNLTNRYIPKFNITPALDNLYTEADKGGFFTPNNLGISVYLDKDFTSVLSVSSIALTGLYEDGTLRAGGRGLTKTDQLTPYTEVIENNIWLKEPVVSGPIAGTIKKNITKKYQKFIPYQSTYESNPRVQLGLVLPTSRQTPWGGIADFEWSDTANKPQSFTGVPNVSAWSETQILKNTTKNLTNWVTDIYGNQYGLYKDIENTNSYDNKNIPGELWVRKNSQNVSSASKALTGVFDTYKSTNFYSQLTGNGIQKIDLFFNTLYVQTSGAVLFEDLIYDYDTDTVFSISDNARYLSLTLPVSTSLTREVQGLTSLDIAKPGETWFFPENKKVVLSVCGLLSGLLTPALYELDLITKNFNKIFPKTQTDITTINSLTGLNIQTIESPVLSYNTLKKEFLLTILGRNNLQKDNIVEFSILNLPDTSLNNVTVYTSTETVYNGLPPFIPDTLSIYTTANNTLVYSVTAQNSPTTFTLLTSIDWITVNNFGVFDISTPTLTGDYYIPFSVSNSVGPTYYSLYIKLTA